MPFEGVKVPPPRATAPREQAPRKVSSKAKAREDAANGLGQIVGFGFMVAGQLADAGAIGMHWPNIAHEAAQVAENDAKMAKAIDYLLEVGPYGNLIIVALPLVAQLLVNHKVLKPEAMAGAGVVHPDALEAQVKTDMARKAMEAMRMQAEAEADMKAMKAELNGLADEMRQNAEASS